MNKCAYISLGTNQGDRIQLLQKALKILEQDPNITIEECSSIYETEPVGYTNQPSFLNMVVKLTTSYHPFKLLQKIQEIELELGRKREIRWGPRTIDLDILLFNNENIMSEQLSVPHPRMFERAFVIIPLLEINKELLTMYKLDPERLQKEQGIQLYLRQQEVCKWIRGDNYVYNW